MNDATPSASTPAGNPLATPGRHLVAPQLAPPVHDTSSLVAPPHLGPADVAPAQAVPAAPAPAGRQQVRTLFCDLGTRMRDLSPTPGMGHKPHRLAIVVSEEVYQEFQSRCQQHDLTVAQALPLLMGGRDLPAVRPVVIPLPAEIDAEALRVLHHLDQRLAACAAGGVMDQDTARVFLERLAAISAALRGAGGPGAADCPCGGRVHAPPPTPPREGLA